MAQWMPLILAVVGVIGGGGGLYSALTVGVTRRKMIAEAASINADTTTVLGKTAVELLTPLRERIHELEQEVDQLRAMVRQLRNESEAKDHVILELSQHRRGARRGNNTA